MPRLHSGAAIDTPETTQLKIPPIPEVVWQQPQETIQYGTTPRKANQEPASTGPQ